MDNITSKQVTINTGSVFWLFFITVLAMIFMHMCREFISTVDMIVDLWVFGVFLILFIRFYFLSKLSKLKKKNEKSIINYHKRGYIDTY